MKKNIFILLLITFALLISGCTKSNKNYDLMEINKELAELSTGKFNMFGVESLIDKKNYFEGLTEIQPYDNYYKNNIKVDSDNFDKYIMRLNPDNKQLYFIILPKEGTKETIKKEFKAYFEELENKSTGDIKNNISNRLEEEYEDYLIYIVSDENNEDIFKLMKSSENLIFNNIISLEDKDSIKNQFDIDVNDLEEYLFALPSFITQSNSYIIVKPKKDKYVEVKKALDTYMTKYEEQWKVYLQDQYVLVRDRLFKDDSGYLIYIISTDNDKVFDVIKNNEIK